MTELSPDLAAARHRRAVSDRSARLSPAGRGRVRLEVLLPSTDAATILLLCDAAAELVR
jgi:hypothetical protein